MATLTGNQIKDTYKSLLKVDDNGELAASLQEITDGNGTGSGVSLNTAGDLKANGTLEFGSLKDTGENITISKFVDAADGIAGNNNDTTIPTSAAVKNYVDANVTAQDLDFTGDTGTGAVDLDSQSLTLTGANGIATTASDQTITIDAGSLNTRLTTAETDIDTNTAAISAETSARSAADTTLQSNINTEASTRASADTTLQGNIDSEASTRSSADTTLQNNIDAEASTRASADISLQSQITSNDADITSLDGRLTTAEGNITSNDTDIATNASNIATNTSNIASNTSSIATNTSNIATNTSNIATNTSDISGLDSRLTTAEGNITSNDTDISTLQSGKQDISEKGQANGYAPLDASAKITTTYLPDSIVGQVEYQGTWDASTNTPTLPTASTVKGHYYIVSTGGTYLSITYDVGDWVISNGTDWQKVDNTDAVSSVFGRNGAILAVEADYSSFYPLISDLNTTNSNVSAIDTRLGTAETKLATIETNADVTDATNVAAAGALMSGTAVLSDLNDVASTSPSDGQILTYDTVNGWQPETPAQGDTYTIGTTTNGSSVDVNLDAATGTDSNITLTPSTGLSITQAADVVTITNTAPDQTVSLTASTGISVTGTYPSFTITNSSPDQTVALTGGTNISVSGTYPSFTIDNDITTTDDLTQGSTNLYNQTHTGDVTGATVLTIADDAVTASKIVDNIQLDGTESVGIPSGTTAERPSVPAAGMLRYNSTTGEFEGYTTAWGAIGGGVTVTKDQFTGDNSTTGFTLSVTPNSADNLNIFISGVYQNSVDSSSVANYSVSGTTLTFVTAPPVTVTNGIEVVITQ